MQKTYNFSAGPAALPAEVLKKIKGELLSYQGIGASIMEISHRSDTFIELAVQMQNDVRDLMAVPDDYAVLFLQGGASSQFSMVPMNLARNKPLNYVITGLWSKKAMLEADRLCTVNVCTNSAANGFADIQDFNKWHIDEQASYLHYTPSETVHGVEFDYLPV